jgi:anti-sigma regulatory factor (Ser/Thr protein kinase)
MPVFTVPTNASLHAANSFFSRNSFFQQGAPRSATLILSRRWMYIEPFALAMVAAWANWCKRNSLHVAVQNLTSAADYAWRMRLFDFLPGVDYRPARTEHEEAGRFLPITNIRSTTDARSVLANISALLHLTDKPEILSAVQYCVSELIRNALEHASSPEGAYVCAQNYATGTPPRVAIGVVDCGEGIAQHLGRVHPAALESDATALALPAIGCVGPTHPTLKPSYSRTLSSRPMICGN